MEDVVLFGTGQNASLAYAHLKYDSPYRVVGFTVDSAYLAEPELLGLPVVPFETVENHFPPDRCGMLVSISFRGVNQLRAEKYRQAKAKGYALINKISGRAVTWPDLCLGDNVVIGAGTNVAPFVTLGSDVHIAAGCVIGHHTVIEDHSYLAAGCVVAGSVRIGAYSLIGTGAVVRDRLTIAPHTVVGAGAVILEDTVERGVYLAQHAQRLPITSDRLAIG